MPEKRTLERARQDAREGKAPTTQAGEFVREEFEHVSEGKHPVSSRKQAIAIGLSKARRAGVKLPPPPAERSQDSKSRSDKMGGTRRKLERESLAKRKARQRTFR